MRKVAKQLPSLLCLLFYSAFSDHAFLFLCVSMHLSQEERRVPRCTTGVVPFPCQTPSFPYTNPTKPSQSPSFPSTRPDEHHPNPKPYFQILSIPVPSISTGLKSETQVKKAKVHSSSASRCGGTWDLDPVEFFLRDFSLLGDWSLRTGPPPSSRV